MKVQLKGRDIPRNTMGDPAFKALGTEQVGEAGKLAAADSNLCVLAVFSADEVVELVNRCLYQLEYQARSHQKRNAEQREFERPVKELLKELYPGTSFAKATADQLARCLKVYAERRAKEGE